MKQLKIFITLILLLLWLTVANAVYEEPMGETIEVDEPEETWFIYPEGGTRRNLIYLPRRGHKKS